MARMFRVQARGTTILVECASFFNRYRPGEKSEPFSVAADAVESIELVDMTRAVRIEVAEGDAAPAMLATPVVAPAALDAGEAAASEPDSD